MWLRFIVCYLLGLILIYFGLSTFQKGDYQLTATAIVAGGVLCIAIFAAEVAMGVTKNRYEGRIAKLEEQIAELTHQESSATDT